jgi:hypothetical protein
LERLRRPHLCFSLYFSVSRSPARSLRAHLPTPSGAHAHSGTHAPCAGLGQAAAAGGPVRLGALSACRRGQQAGAPTAAGGKRKSPGPSGTPPERPGRDLASCSLPVPSRQRPSAWRCGPSPARAGASACWPTRRAGHSTLRNTRGAEWTAGVCDVVQGEPPSARSGRGGGGDGVAAVAHG